VNSFERGRSAVGKQINDQYWEHKKRTLAGYEAGSGTYDMLYGEEQEKKYERCSRYLRGVAGKLVLDCGCGTGTLLRRFFGQHGFFVGVDYSRAMLKLAQKRVGPARDVALVCADADSLPFKSATFDRVVSFTMLGNMPEMERTLRELGRVARDSAQIVLSFAKKNVEADQVLRLMKVTSVRPRDLVDDEDLKDWVAVGEKTSEVAPECENTC